MSEPELLLTPLKAATRKGQATEMTMIVRVMPPALEAAPAGRPPLNLGLVIDRSGSMHGPKMPRALEAARFAIEQLVPTDRVSVTVFDDHIDTLVPNQPAADKAGIVARLNGVAPRGSTALHGGWAEGAAQTEKGLAKEALNRVILLSDGQANVGLSDPDQIATEVHAAKGRGVGTSTIGVGDDYNENLMQAMARAGDGNYYFIDDPKIIPEILGAELRGLVATIGTEVTLTLEPQNGAEVAEVLNDLPSGPGGLLKLPNLVLGMPVDVAVKLKAPACEGVTELLRVRLEWSAADGSGRRATARSLIVPAVDEAEYEALPADSGVAEKARMLEIGRMKLATSAALDRGDRVLARAMLCDLDEALYAMPASPMVANEMADLRELGEDLEAGNIARASKRAKFQSFSLGRGQSRGTRPGSAAEPPAEPPQP
jgi:Ca-activated chloride channel family protein